MSAILVLVEHLKGTMPEITFEMLGAARKLGDALQAQVHAVAVGKGVSAFAPQLGAADNVIVVEDPTAELPSAELVLAVLQQQREQKQAAFVLLGGTNVSFGLGARLSARTKAPFINFCKGLRVEGGAVVLTSAVCGGKILADVRPAGNKGIVSVYPGSFPPDAGKSSRTPPVEVMAAPAVQSKAIFRRILEPAAGDIDITKMDALVSVGRGIQNADNIPLAEELAQALGGAVSASRPVVDQGWLPLTRQVGKSGMSVSPKLYLALGISGAPEHWEGMKGAQLVVAVNTDPKAPIFDFAHYGANVDCLDLIEPLKEAVAKRKAAK
jgi:electron transfer flavoprotein alpha subunit